ncbi:MAG: MBL fold metallo-hydrolase [Halanaerobiaceae bacterium]|nr:MBL fold metallo-hydrolase [Halanaerobiaceae bacterium]
MDKRKEYELIKLETGLWVISDYRNSSMYVVESRDRALLVDTGMGTGDLKGFVEKITDKPLELILTHAHWDHTGQADLFENPYMSHKEEEIISLFEDILDLDIADFRDIKDGDIFDLGDRKLEVIELPGHTPGSIVLLDTENEILISGDAIGTGHLWMHVPGALPLAEYLISLKKLEKRKDEFRRIYPGHIKEVGNKPLDLEYFNNVIFLVEKVLAGELKGKKYQNRVFPGLYVEKGQALLVYDPDRIR